MGAGTSNLNDVDVEKTFRELHEAVDELRTAVLSDQLQSPQGQKRYMKRLKSLKKRVHKIEAYVQQTAGAGSGAIRASAPGRAGAGVSADVGASAGAGAGTRAVRVPADDDTDDSDDNNAGHPSWKCGGPNWNCDARICGEEGCRMHSPAENYYCEECD